MRRSRSRTSSDAGGLMNIRDLAVPEPGLWEYAATDRFQGKVVGLSIGKKF